MYMKAYMKRYREAESSEKRLARLGKERIRQRDRMRQMDDKKKDVVRTKIREHNERRRFRLTDEEHLEKLKDNRFEKNLKYMGLSEMEQERKKQRMKLYSRAYRKELKRYGRKYSLGIYLKSRRHSILIKNRDDHNGRRRSHEHYLYSTNIMSKAMAIGYFKSRKDV